MQVDHTGQRVDVVCVGRVMVDILFTDLPRLPSIGEELYAERYFIDVGGGAAITAIGLRKLGLDTAIVASVSDDLFGQLIYEELRTHGVDLRCFRHNEARMTNLSMEMTFPTDRATVTVVNLDNDLGLNDAIAELLLHSRHLHVIGLSEARIELLEFAIARGLTTSVDTNLRQETQRGLIAQAFPFIDLLMPNLAEVSGLSKSDDVQETAMKLGDSVRGYCIIKMGPKGALASDGQSVVKVNAFPVPVVDTTGAGDAFNAGFIYSFLRGCPLERCLLIGNAMGSLKVRKPGGVLGMPTLDQLQDFLSRQGVEFSM